ncbi:MAG TPA: STAS domain-containing protein [Bryobacteraceae bacterium]|nr:STAS domain-containing protein [Bryobacteraceae bacterium]
MPAKGKEHVVRLEGDQTMAAAARLKAELFEALERDSPGVRVDLDAATDLDVTTLQLLWAAERAAAAGGRSFVCRSSDGQRRLAREAGFERFPGEPAWEGGKTAEG